MARKRRKPAAEAAPEPVRVPILARPTPQGPPPGWRASDLEVLAAVAETFSPGGAIRRAALISHALADVTDPADQRLLRLALRTFDSRSANLLLGAGPVRFRDLGQERRERHLLGWATSRIGGRRTAFQVLKRLSLFFAYADDGPDGSGSPNWRRIGYAPSEEPVSPEPSPIAPLAVGEATTLEADVAIVGSGAGGGVVAQELARAGRSVIVIEAGPYVRESEMTQHEMDGFDRLYLDHGLLATDDAGVVVLAGGGLGGGTTVNWASCFPPPDWLRAEWAGEHGLDGFDDEEADADLAALAHELGYDDPPSIPPKDAAILRGARALGWEASPMVRNAGGCGDCGACGFGCRRGAKRSGPRLHLAEAARRGARFLVEAPVTRILLEGGRATGVEGRTRGGHPFAVRARQVVVAAGALRTPVILERSGLRHPALGRYLRLHPVAAVIGRYVEPIEMWRGTTQAARSAEFAGPNGFIIESVPAHPGLAALAFPWAGLAESQAILDRLRHFAPLVGVCRDHDGGSLTLRRSGSVRISYRVSPRDTATLRRSLVATARLHRAARAVEVAALGTPAAWFGHAGFVAGSDIEAQFEGYLDRLGRFDFSPNRGLLGSAHQMGTARMGAGPRDHACDPRGRVRADARDRMVGALYVADASLFPSASGVNPMVTVMALARRVARTVLAES